MDTRTIGDSGASEERQATQFLQAVQAGVGQAVSTRRRHSAEFKTQAVSACMRPGISIAAVALHYRLNARLLRRWVFRTRRYTKLSQHPRRPTVFQERQALTA